MKYAIPSYKKAIKVIDSCSTLDHCTGARKYINNFFNQNSKLTKQVKTGFREYITEDYIGEMYERLKLKLYGKELDIRG